MTLTVIGISFAILLGGAVIIEQVFNIPGLGRLIISAVLRRDYPIIQGVILMVAGVYVLALRRPHLRDGGRAGGGPLGRRRGRARARGGYYRRLDARISVMPAPASRTAGAPAGGN